MLVERLKGKMGVTMKCAKWAVLAILMIILCSELVLSEAEIESKNIEPGRLPQTQGTFITRNRPDEIVRTDPLDHFYTYSGNYNITDIHYWSATIFTGIYGYAIGVLWIIAGIVYALYLLTASYCKTKNQDLKRGTPCRKPCIFFPLVLSTILTILAIIAAGAAMGGSIRLHSRAKTIISVMINTADQASNTIHKATGPMRKISINLEQQATYGVNSVDGTDTAAIAGAASFLASTSDKLDYAATGIKKQAQKNRYFVEKGLTILYILTIITISLNLAGAIVLTVFGLLKFRRAFHILILFCWFLTALYWLLFGAYFVLNTFTSDTCTALHDFQQNQDDSSLGSILPCDEFLSARNVLSDVGIGIYEIVDQVNTNITLLRSNSYPGLQYVCNPFSGPPDFLYQPQNCAAGTIRIGDIPQVLKMFTCSDTTGTSCQGAGIITTSEYHVIEDYTTSIQSFLNAYPEMQNLVDCQLVKHASSKILINHCKPLKSYAQTTWIAMLVLSVVMVILILLWASAGHHDQKHHFADGTIQPNSTEANNRDPEAAKPTTEHQVK